MTGTIEKEIEKEIKMLERAAGEESYRYTAESVAHSKIRLNIYQAWLADSKAKDKTIETLRQTIKERINFENVQAERIRDLEDELKLCQTNNPILIRKIRKLEAKLAKSLTAEEVKGISVRGESKKFKIL